MIIQEGMKWLETPWRHQGRTKRGIDCAGLIINIGKALNLMDYDVRHYPRDTRKDVFVNHFKACMIEQNVRDRQPGDVLLFRDGIYACHCGILNHVNNIPHILHAYVGAGKTVNDPITKEMGEKITHCFRYPGVGVLNGWK